MIVKCQRSLTSSEPEPQMLFYDRGKQHIAQFDVTPEWEARFAPARPRKHRTLDDYRFFAEVLWTDLKQPPTFIRRLPEQDW